MGLTVFVSNKDSSVRVLEWFCTEMGRALESPCGPLLHFQADEFRRMGSALIRQHFVTYRTKRLSNEPTIPVFTTRAEKRTLAGQRVLRIGEERDGRIRLIPIEVVRLSLFALKCLPDEFNQFVTQGASDESFWEAFDKALKHSVFL
jgi:hypothetical protein